MFYVDTNRKLVVLRKILQSWPHCTLTARPIRTVGIWGGLVVGRCRGRSRMQRTGWRLGRSVRLLAPTVVFTWS